MNFITKQWNHGYIKMTYNWRKIIIWTHNEEKTVSAERFITAFKNKIYKCMTSVSKNVHIDKLDDIVNKYNNTYHSTDKMKPVDLKSSTYIDYCKKVNDKDPKFKIADILN